MKTMTLAIALVLLSVATGRAEDVEAPYVRYIANAGVMIVHDGTKVIVDPLYRNTFDTYDAVPAGVEGAILEGRPPFDGISAVLISHAHEDHFDAALLLALLEQQPDVDLYGPAEAVTAIREVVDGSTAGVLPRLHGIDLDYGDAPERVLGGTLAIDAVRIPHAGWPDRHGAVQNLVFRVTLRDQVTVLHLGDAETALDHFAAHAAFWDERGAHLALPPYWFFLSTAGRDILETRIDARQNIGVHVPTEVPDDPAARPPAFEGFDIFTRPGETRSIRLAE